VGRERLLDSPKRAKEDDPERRIEGQGLPVDVKSQESTAARLVRQATITCGMLGLWEGRSVGYIVVYPWWYTLAFLLLGLVVVIVVLILLRRL
jgi:hypothetical protein